MEDNPAKTEPFVSAVRHGDDDLFRLLVEAVKDYGLFMVDAGGYVSSWNPGAAKSKGYTAEEIIGRHFSCFYTPEDVAAGKPEHGLQIALDEGRFEEEGLRVRNGGETFWAISTITSIHDTAGQLIGFANVTRDITERKESEGMLRLRDRAIQSLTQGLCITDPTQSDNPIIYVNDGFIRLTGFKRDEVLGRNCRLLQGAKTAPEAVARIRAAITEEKACLVQLENYRRDGTTFWNGLSISPIRDADGCVTNFVGVLTDISDVKIMERQLLQAQKMEVIGQLAGGVAHDFNNLLTIISGYSEILLDVLSPEDPKREAITAISEAGERAAGLTRQLLFFSRQATLEMKVVDLNDLVKQTESLLRRMIGEDVLLTAVLDPNLHPVRADPGQIGQILMNLAVNARDAMPQGGKLTIKTLEMNLAAGSMADQPDFKPGRYVVLSVTDTGMGMGSEVQSHIFEPFFTTKGPKQGTGLGLATVYGIVKQSGGMIELFSEIDFGTCFKIYLPSLDQEADRSVRDLRAKVASGTETILLVEDEDAVRALGTMALQTQGYFVLPAGSGRDAMRAVARHGGKVDLLVTDVVMQGMSGREVAESLVQQHPALKVLYVSGYNDDSVIRHGVLQAEVSFLQKPYTPHSLARKVREVLDGMVNLA